ncbi:hypothetical protein T440DRAFT_55344 [Plenodomus tracheiphilus IPT5]|uniref:Uncharacterized protein n=1 Tax=Plenodomus tracheiphilus IPT5 TaxID=1408161 RepID=A0A6A7B859_9PLEO|nr:hypothetical protein T440DRAFT_55344 [Plenodomus tracheiphilus IPT5]
MKGRNDRVLQLWRLRIRLFEGELGVRDAVRLWKLHMYHPVHDVLFMRLFVQLLVVEFVSLVLEVMCLEIGVQRPEGAFSVVSKVGVEILGRHERGSRFAIFWMVVSVEGLVLLAGDGGLLRILAQVVLEGIAVRNWRRVAPYWVLLLLLSGDLWLFGGVVAVLLFLGMWHREKLRR